MEGFLRYRRYRCRFWIHRQRFRWRLFAVLWFALWKTTSPIQALRIATTILDERFRQARRAALITHTLGTATGDDHES